MVLIAFFTELITLWNVRTMIFMMKGSQFLERTNRRTVFSFEKYEFQREMTSSLFQLFHKNKSKLE